MSFIHVGLLVAILLHGMAAEPGKPDVGLPIQRMYAAQSQVVRALVACREATDFPGDTAKWHFVTATSLRAMLSMATHAENQSVAAVISASVSEAGKSPASEQAPRDEAFANASDLFMMHMVTVKAQVKINERLWTEFVASATTPAVRAYIDAQIAVARTIKDFDTTAFEAKMAGKAGKRSE